jgi:hypothetical protein
MQFDNKIFWVNYRPGSCGAFVSLILTQLLWPELSRIEDFPIKALADDSLNRHIKSCRVITEFVDMPRDYPIFAPNSHTLPLPFILDDRIVELPSHLPEIVITGHRAGDLKLRQQRFPHAQQLIITVSKSSLLRLYANYYYKVVDRTELSALAIPKVRAMWKNSTIRRGLIKNLDIFHLPSWAVEEYVNNQFQEWPHPKDPDDQNLMWRPETRYDPDIEQTIRRVDMWRIIHDSQQLLNELADWVDRPVNDIARATWANYLARQQELLPWLEDR